MKRASAGKGSSQQPGILKPRNAEFTPNNRQSAGQSVRRSFVQKMGQADSAKRVYSRVMRGSTENVLRSTLVSSRFTPTRTNNAAWVPQSTNRMSIDSARSSGMGMSTRKDTRPITDPAYKTQCIDKVMDFLRKNGYPHSYQRRTLLTPSTNDFTNIFSFVYKHLEPSYTLPTRYAEEIPKLLKKMNYPVQMTKSSFVTVGSPHTWPAVLAMLVFLVDMVNYYNILNQDLASPFDLDADEGCSRRSLFISLYNCKDEDEIIAGLEEFSENLKTDENVSEKAMEELQEEVETSECSLESLPNTVEELKQLQECYIQCSDDLRKLTSYCQNLQLVIESKTVKQKNTEQRLAELHECESMICEEVENLKRLQAQQSFSSTDLIHFKNHSQEVGSEIEQQECLGTDLQSQVWHAELEIAKVQPCLRSSFAMCEDLLGKLELSDVSDMLTSYEDLDHHSDAIIDKITAWRKSAKKSTSQAQKKVWELEQEISKVKGIFQEKQTESKKLETKIRHSEEEFNVAQEEIAQEEQVRLEETEFLHQQIMEARKSHKKSLYQLQRVKEDKQRELEGYKKKEEMCLWDGAQFLMKICHEAIHSAEHKDSMIAEYIAHVNVECDQFHQWLDIVIKKE